MILMRAVVIVNSVKVSLATAVAVSAALYLTGSRTFMSENTLINKNVCSFTVIVVVYVWKIFELALKLNKHSLKKY